MAYLFQWLAVPFAITNPVVSSLSLNETNWVGNIEPTSPEWGLWVDYWLLLICGKLTNFRPLLNNLMCYTDL